MDRVGGYTSYLALLGDERAYDDVLAAMAGELDAHNILKLEATVKANAGGGA